jgi:hypothetical protein
MLWYSANRKKSGNCSWNPMVVETVLSMLTLVCHLKHVMHRPTVSSAKNSLVIF